ncbi:alpha/beta fold hydrolase [Mycoplasma sp. P36-A1]|uniref:alpha/beta fold hydrolase n=1 Tax=Mycoplasma sp. P36-A1 TaxID=3252900 RepID=UPI003C300161
MNNILIHGLGQNKDSWTKTKNILEKNHIIVHCPNLIKNNMSISYQNIYDSFKQDCNKLEGKINLCGLSLGGIIALEYAKEYPNKVNSLIIIGTPYKMPKTMLKIQNIVFKFMPEHKFISLGCSKKDFITLTKSIADLDLTSNLDKITCKTLVLCGAKDKINLKSSKSYHKEIINSEFALINNASHEVNIDNPELLANKIINFYSNLS